MSTNTRGLGVWAQTGDSTALLQSRSGSDLASALTALSPDARQNLEARLGSSAVRELASISGESNPEMFAEQMMHFAGGLENGAHLPDAVSIYQGLRAIPEVAARAEERLLAIGGGASFGSRAEFLLGRFHHELFRPEPLAAMALSSLAFRATRVATLSRLLSGARPGLLVSTLGPRALANGSAFLAEATTFALAQKGMAQALGTPSSWSIPSLGRDIASSVLFLGALRLGGASANFLSRGTSRLLPASSAERMHLLQQVFQQGGMLAGIHYAHRLEEWAGLRAPSSHAAVDSLVSLLHFNVLGHLSRRLMGPAFRELENGLDQHAELLSRTRIASTPEIFGPISVSSLAHASIGSPRGRMPSEARELISLMVGDGEGGTPRPPRGGANHTLPFGMRSRDLPLLFESIFVFLRQINDPRLGFNERLRVDDVNIKINEDVSAEGRQSFPEIFLQHLNIILSRKEIPDGRLVQVQIAENPLINFVKIGNAFRLSSGSTPPFAMSTPPPGSSPEAARIGESLKTLPFGMHAPGRDPRVSMLSIELLRRIRDPEYRFAEYIQRQDVEFTLEREDAFDLDAFSKILIRTLNDVPNVPLERTVTIVLEPSHNRHTIVRGSEGFNLIANIPSVARERARMGTADTIIAPLEPEVLAKLPPVPPLSRPEVVSPPQLTISRSLPIIARHLGELPQMISRSLQQRQEGEYPQAIILERTAESESAPSTPLTLAQIQALLGEIPFVVPIHMITEVNVPSMREVFIAEVRGNTLTWRKGSPRLLESATFQIVSRTINAQGPTALYQIIEALSREPERPEVTIHYRSSTSESAGELRDFLARSLNGVGLKGQIFRLQLDSGDAIVLNGRNGIWTGSESETETRIASSQLDIRPIVQEILNPQFRPSVLEVFLERGSVLTTSEIRRMEEDLASLPEGRRLRIYDFKGRKTVTFGMSGTAVKHVSESWSRPEDLQVYEAANFLELAQRLAWLRGSIMPVKELRVQLRGPDPFTTRLPAFIELLNKWLWFPTKNFEVDVVGSDGSVSSRWSFQNGLISWNGVRLQ